MSPDVPINTPGDRPMNETTAPPASAPSSGTMSSARLEEFQREVEKLKVSGGGANPERLAERWGIGLTIVGFVIAAFSWLSAYEADNFADIHRSAIAALIGVGVAVIGIVIWLRNSMTRYLRYWIIRLVYEQREQTEQLVDAVKR
jgi:hypothetical protein